MRKLVMVAGLLVLGACASGPSAGGVYDGAPDWVVKGSGAFGGSQGKAFYGVGSASNIQNPGLRRRAADSQARAEIAKILNTYVANLEKQYQESTFAGDEHGQAQEVQMVTNALKSFTQAQLNGVQIVDHWISKDGSTEFALALLDFDMMKDSMDRVNTLNDRMRAVVKARSDAAFDELAAEEARR